MYIHIKCILYTYYIILYIYIYIISYIILCYINFILYYFISYILYYIIYCETTRPSGSLTWQRIILHPQVSPSSSRWFFSMRWMFTSTRQNRLDLLVQHKPSESQYSVGKNIPIAVEISELWKFHEGNIGRKPLCLMGKKHGFL